MNIGFAQDAGVMVSKAVLRTVGFAFHGVVELADQQLFRKRPSVRHMCMCMGQPILGKVSLCDGYLFANPASPSERTERATDSQAATHPKDTSGPTNPKPTRNRTGIQSQRGNGTRVASDSSQTTFEPKEHGEGGGGGGE